MQVTAGFMRFGVPLDTHKSVKYTHWGAALRTNIEIDDKLMRKALRASGATTKKAAVEAGLRLLVRMQEQEKALGLWGAAKWEGDLEQSRLGHVRD
jgi:Arc/MetJ family transcription regulator